MKTILYSLLLTLLLICPCFAHDIPPTRENVTKNIHLVLDFSGSMTSGDIEKRLEYFSQISSQPIDDYNLSVTIFAKNFIRMVPGDDCDRNEKLGRYWMAMPSVKNINAINAWIEQQSESIIDSNTNVYPPLHNAIIEDVRDLSIIVISDCRFDDKRALYGNTDILQQSRKNGAAQIGFIDVDECPHSTEKDKEQWGGSVYLLCKSKGWWLLNVGGICD